MFFSPSLHSTANKGFPSSKTTKSTSRLSLRNTILLMSKVDYMRFYSRSEKGGGDEQQSRGSEGTHLEYLGGVEGAADEGAERSYSITGRRLADLSLYRFFYLCPKGSKRTLVFSSSTEIKAPRRRSSENPLMTSRTAFLAESGVISCALT